MTLKNFRKNLKAYQLKKGLDYFKVGFVKGLRESKVGKWSANVTGSSNYRVHIQFQENTIEDCSCDCPHDTEYCKHVIAVLYAIQERKDMPVKKNSSKKKTNNNKGSFVSLIESIIHADNYSADRYGRRYNPRELNRQLDVLKRKAKNALASKKYVVATDIVFALIETIHPMHKNTDDSRDVAYDVVQDAFELLLEICESSIPVELRKRIFKHASDELFDHSYNALYDPGWLTVCANTAPDLKSQEWVLRIIDPWLSDDADPAYLSEEFEWENLVIQKALLLERMQQGDDMSMHNKAVQEIDDAIIRAGEDGYPKVRTELKKILSRIKREKRSRRSK